MRAMLVMVLVLGAPVLATDCARAVEQTIVPLTPPVEQRVTQLGGETGQRVEGVEPLQDQAVGAQEPPSPGAKAASTAGKIVVGVLAAVVACAAMAAQLLLL